MKILIGLGVLVIIVVAVVFSLPFLVDLNKYQDQYKPLLEEALNRKVQMQDIRLTIWPRIGARVAGFAVLDDPVFGATPFTSLTSLEVGVKLRPLLSGKVDAIGYADGLMRAGSGRMPFPARCSAARRGRRRRPPPEP